MPNLITKIEGVVTNETIANINTFKNIDIVVGTEDYINVYSLLAYLQNFKQVSEVKTLNKPLKFGLNNNKSFTELDISY